MAKSFKKQVRQMFENVNVGNLPVVTSDNIQHLPIALQNYLEFTKSVNKPIIKTARLKQTGVFKTKPNAPWFKLKAVEYFITEKPFFYWKGIIKPVPFMYVTGIDKFDGKGHLKIKIFNLLKIGEEKGANANEAELLRYLAEMLWMPTTALSDFIKWEEIDDKTVKGFIEWEEIKAEATFYFDGQGRLLNIVSKRFMSNENGIPKYETWETPVDDYRDFNGYYLPSKGAAIYKLEEGDYKYIDINITNIEFNVKEVY